MLAIFGGGVFLVNRFVMFLVLAENLDTEVRVTSNLIAATSPDVLADVLRKQYGVLTKLNLVSRFQRLLMGFVDDFRLG